MAFRACTRREQFAGQIGADFALGIWRGLGATQQPSVFTNSEMLVALGVMLVNGLSVLILDTRIGFSTGYTAAMMKPLVAAARDRGYDTNVMATISDVRS